MSTESERIKRIEARHIFASYVEKQIRNNLGSNKQLNLYPPNNDASIMPKIYLGQQNTTLDEYNSYVLAATGSTNQPSEPSVPDAPIITSIMTANELLVIQFTEPANGGSAITDYEYSIDNGTTFISSETTISPIVIGSLTNGTTYNVTIRAINSLGTGPSSNTVSGTPSVVRVTFTTTGATSWTAPEGITSIEYLVVGGGGGSGGGFDTGAGAGGGGGMVLTGSLSITPGTTYTVEVGSGGTAGISDRNNLPETRGGAGGNSSFDTIIALGGEAGYPSRQPANFVNGDGGAAAINPTTAAEGGNGGGANGGGGGGGGSSGAGGNKSGATGGTGGAGTITSFSGTPTTYGLGGAGGNGGINNNGVAGTANRGNGARGGGAIPGSSRNGAAGGSGIVIIKY